VPAAAIPASLNLMELAAFSTRQAWMVLADSPHSRLSYLYATDDGGATWVRIAAFEAHGLWIEVCEPPERQTLGATVVAT